MSRVVAFLLASVLSLPSVAKETTTADAFKADRDFAYSQLKKIITDAGCQFTMPSPPTIEISSNLPEGASGYFDPNKNAIVIGKYDKDVIFHELTHNVFDFQSFGPMCAYIVLARAIAIRAPRQSMGDGDQFLALTYVRQSLIVLHTVAIMAARSNAIVGSVDTCQLDADSDSAAKVLAQGMGGDIREAVKNVSMFVITRSALSERCVNEMLAYSMGEYLARTAPKAKKA